MAERPIGQRFSLVYMDRGEPSPDVSDRARHRISRLLDRVFYDGMNGAPRLNEGAIYSKIEEDLGIEVPWM